MSIPFSVKVNERLVGFSIAGENHIIGIVGTATYAPGFIRLTEVPEGPFPAVTIPGYTEIASGVPTGTQFLVDYTTGVITFATAQDGNSVSASYMGLGSEFAAEDVNELQNPLSTIVSQSITYNWPLAPTVTWALTNGIVTNSSVSASAAISYSKLATLGGSTNDVLIQNGSGFISPSSILSTNLFLADGSVSATGAFNLNSHQIHNVTDPTSLQDAATKNYVDTHITSPAGANTQIQYNNSGVFGASSNLTWDNALTKLEIQGVNPNLYLSGSAIPFITLFSTTGAHVVNIEIASSSLIIETNNMPIGMNDANDDGAPNASALLDLRSTTRGFLPPRMTTTQRNAISSPAAGLIVYDTTTNQWYGYNGTSWVILG